MTYRIKVRESHNTINYYPQYRYKYWPVWFNFKVNESTSERYEFWCLIRFDSVEGARRHINKYKDKLESRKIKITYIYE